MPNEDMIHTACEGDRLSDPRIDYLDFLDEDTSDDEEMD